MSDLTAGYQPINIQYNSTFVLGVVVTMVTSTRSTISFYNGES